MSLAHRSADDGRSFDFEIGSHRTTTTRLFRLLAFSTNLVRILRLVWLFDLRVRA